MELKKGDKVILISDGANASDFTFKLKNVPDNGVYSINNCINNTIFTIHGDVQPCYFEHNPETTCAYLLLYNGKKVGYVYNYALKKCIKPYTFKEFCETLQPYEIEGAYGRIIESGYIMYYVPNDSPTLNMKFKHRNKRKAFKLYKEYFKLKLRYDI